MTTGTPAKASRRPAVESGNSSDDDIIPRVRRRPRNYRRIVLDDDDDEDEDEDVGDTSPTNLPIRPRRGPGPSSSPAAVATPTTRPRPAAAPEETLGSPLALTSPVHMMAVPGPEGTIPEGEILSRIPARRVGVLPSTSASQSSPSDPPRPITDPSMIRLPAAIREDGAPPPWSAAPELADNQFDHIRRQYEPILNTMPRWSFITIEAREKSNRDIRLTGAGSERGIRFVGNIQLNIRLWRPRPNCPVDCAHVSIWQFSFIVNRILLVMSRMEFESTLLTVMVQCETEHTRFGVPRPGAVRRDGSRIPERRQVTHPSEASPDSDHNEESEGGNENQGKGRFRVNAKAQ